jgi:hypothetical protein
MVNYCAPYVNAPMLRLSALDVAVSESERRNTKLVAMLSNVRGWPLVISSKGLPDINPNQITHQWPSVARWRAF